MEKIDLALPMRIDGSGIRIHTETSVDLNFNNWIMTSTKFRHKELPKYYSFHMQMSRKDSSGQLFT